jgi:hypothetical protein
MKKGKILLGSLCATLLLLAVYSFTSAENGAPDTLTGAWMDTEDGNESVLLFADGYVTHTVYNKAKKQFMHTRGGPYTLNNGTFSVLLEFDTESKDRIGQRLNGSVEVKGDNLKINLGNDSETWKRIDAGQAPLAGVWHITHRMQNDSLTRIHQTGPRKTIKILTGTRFQWAAINPETKEFSGTGGGTYTFANGKYTEHLEFFSRDSSRVGAALSFDDRLENGAWHHTGLSSRGDKIYEVWGRVK